MSPEQSGQNGGGKQPEHEESSERRELTEQEKAELANIQRSIRLANVILPQLKNRSITQVDATELSADNLAGLPVLQKHTLIEGINDKTIGQEDRLNSYMTGSLALNQQKYNSMRLSLRDLRDNSSRRSRLGESELAQEREYLSGGGRLIFKVELTHQIDDDHWNGVIFWLFQGGTIVIHDTANSKIDPESVVTDPAKRMAALDQLYEIMSAAQADLPGGSIAQPANPTDSAASGEVE